MNSFVRQRDGAVRSIMRASEALHPRGWLWIAFAIGFGLGWATRGFKVSGSEVRFIHPNELYGVHGHASHTNKEVK